MKKVLVCLFTLFLVSVSALGGTWTSGSTTITTSGSTLTVSGNGAMADYTYSDATPWLTSSITNIIIEEGVTHIGAYALSETSTNVTSVTIPLSVTSMGEEAFYGNPKIAKIYYAGSPNEWAAITFANQHAHPFFSSGASSRNFYFYGCDFTTTTLTFEPGITTINNYAFQKATIANLNIPGSIEHIGAYAFACSVSSTVCINRATPPTAGTNAITYGGSAKLYVPSGAVSTYNAAGKPWKNSTAEYGPGATAQVVSGTLSATYGSGVTWTLDQDGILTLDASSPSASKSVTLGAGGSYPWGTFRRLVHKVRLRGEITALGDALAYHWFLRGLILDQNAVPTCSNNIGSSNLSGSTSYNSIINPCHPLVMEVPLSTILDDTESAKLEVAPWNDGHWQVTVTDEVLIDEDYDNISLLNTLHDKLSAPFNMRLKRSVSTAYYNTFCSPIDMDAATVSATFGAGTQIYALTSTSYDEEENELTLEFANSQNYMEAGVPYLFKPANNVTNPTFTDVDPASVATAEGEVNTTHVTFKGTLEPVEVSSAQIDAQNFIFLLANNQLTWANGGTLKAMRAYWLLKDGVPSRALSRRPVMRIGQSAQAIGNVQEDNVQSTKILRNGQLIIIRDGVEYNAQGIRL